MLIALEGVLLHTRIAKTVKPGTGRTELGTQAEYPVRFAVRRAVSAVRSNLSVRLLMVRARAEAAAYERSREEEA